ncbi:MAG: nucleoside monophosphate kinase [Candidatus Harrisonbacteria bacterium]|nr:nucleoside monophosphate kinase [Candidatus Harrisonbacteria bacterium]
MAKKAVIIYGPPGSGKGTQANLLAWTKSFIHFDTGKYLESVVRDPELQNKPEIKEQRQLFDSGRLLDPPFVLKVVSEKTKQIAKSGYSIVFSGSPRTMFEAFGEGKEKGLVRILEMEYGRENLYFIFIDIPPEEAIGRNKTRRVCSVCHLGILYSDETHNHKTCPICGGNLRIRTVDNPEVLSTRIEEYEKRTAPILAELKSRNYLIIKINGKLAPHKVFEELEKKLNF